MDIIKIWKYIYTNKDIINSRADITIVY
jgi:hypothetical protein